MPVDAIHFTIGSLFVAVWAMVGTMILRDQYTKVCRTRRTSERHDRKSEAA